jgi:hypothetical protein
MTDPDIHARPVSGRATLYRLGGKQTPGPPHTGGPGSIGKAIAWAVVAFLLWSAFRTIRNS